MIKKYSKNKMKNERKRIFVCYKNGKYVIVDLNLKKKGHTQRF